MKSSLAAEASLTKRSYALRREPHITTFHRLRLSLGSFPNLSKEPLEPDPQGPTSSACIASSFHEQPDTSHGFAPNTPLAQRSSSP